MPSICIGCFNRDSRYKREWTVCFNTFQSRVANADKLSVISSFSTNSHKIKALKIFSYFGGAVSLGGYGEKDGSVCYAQCIELVCFSKSVEGRTCANVEILFKKICIADEINMFSNNNARISSKFRITNDFIVINAHRVINDAWVIPNGEPEILVYYQSI